MDPCVDFCFNRFGKTYTEECNDRCEYAKAVRRKKELEDSLEETKRPFKTIYDAAGILCTVLECENCPVTIHNYDRRTEHEKCTLHKPCVDNLVEWLREEAGRQGG